ncbi:threonine--tRNA ligase [Chloroflexota bacterium]
MFNMNQETKTELETIRHSVAHVMAEAVLSLFPDAKFGIGPAIADGFYYDFDLPRSLTNDDLPEIEQRMKTIIKARAPFVRKDIPREEAKTIFAGQPYKLEIIEEIPDDTISIYTQGNFTDLCRGPHIESAGQIRAFKLLSTAGAYWRGDEKRPMLQRIYGIAFESKDALKEHLHKLEEAARRDHRKLGRELDLYSMHEEAGPGLIHWHPKGATLRRIIEDFWKEVHIRRGYDIVYTPHISRVDLWKTSGHWEFYQENLYSPMDIDEQQYIIKPMNCAGHILIYNTKIHSYRELPLRFAELGTVYRYERSGVLHGLARVRGFTQDDAHIFCRFDQMEQELVRVLELTRFMMETFGFTTYKVMLSTRPKKYAGALETWDTATETLRKALKKTGTEYEVDPGEGVFYGPKIDTKIEDALGRQWQGPTVQVDFNLPQRFDVNYVGEDGDKHQVAMLHRTVLGSMERFVACLIEHYGGAFPVWLSPVQVRVIPVADRHLEYAAQIDASLKEQGIRADTDTRSERINQKIRLAQVEKVPFMLIVGDKEVEKNTISVRLRTGEQQNDQTLNEFSTHVVKLVAERTAELS